MITCEKVNTFHSVIVGYILFFDIYNFDNKKMEGRFKVHVVYLDFPLFT